MHWKATGLEKVNFDIFFSITISSIFTNYDQLVQGVPMANVHEERLKSPYRTLQEMATPALLVARCFAVIPKDWCVPTAAVWYLEKVDHNYRC
jgi:hypothetical protein